MQRSNRMPAAKRIILCVLGALIYLLPSSCSLFTCQEPQVPIKVEYQPPPPPKCELPYCQVNLDLPLTAVFKPKIYIFKSERRLLLVNDDTLVREYRIGLGPHPKGDKYFQGDGRTPEGDYYVCAKNPSSKYYKSLGLSYPTPKRATEAFTLGEISQDEYLKIVEANEKGVLPPANTCLGGAIFIHGGGSFEDWTLGCVAVSNRYMDELFEVVSTGTPVSILP